MIRVFALAPACALVLFAFARAGDAASPPTIGFATPADGSTVAGPRVEVALDVRGTRLVPAGSQVKSGEGHAHVLVDRAAPGAREFLSTDDPQIVHLGKAPLSSRSIELDEGQHTLVAVLGDSEHLVVPGQRTATVRITVAPGFRGKGTLTPACADVAQGQGDVRITFPTDGGAVQGTISTACVFPTQNGACVWTDTKFSRISGSYDPSSGRLTGQATGLSQRRLRSGPRKTCGTDRESGSGSAPVAAERQSDGSLAGTVSRARFAMASDDSVDLASAPSPLAASTTASKTGAPKRNRLPAYAAFAGAAVLLGVAGVSFARSR